MTAAAAILAALMLTLVLNPAAAQVSYGAPEEETTAPPTPEVPGAAPSGAPEAETNTEAGAAPNATGEASSGTASPAEAGASGPSEAPSEEQTGQTPAGDATGDGAAGPPPQTDPTVAQIPDPPRERNGFVISGQGVGPFTTQTYFNRSAIIAGLPDAQIGQVAADFRTSESPVILFRADKRDGSVYIFYPGREGRIGQIVLTDTSAHLPNGIGVGDSYATAYDARPSPPCQAGAGDLRGRVLCQSSDSRNVTYIFAPDGQPWTGQRKPPKSGMMDWRIEAIMWRSSF